MGSRNGDAINWITAGAVTDVKDQGQCGSCWSFSSTGSIEGAHFVATGELLSFSEQQLVECSHGILGNHGCNGGLQTSSYQYVTPSNPEQMQAALTTAPLAVAIEADKM